jgi:hypothetical protein
VPGDNLSANALAARIIGWHVPKLAEQPLGLAVA